VPGGRRTGKGTSTPTAVLCGWLGALGGGSDGQAGRSDWADLAGLAARLSLAQHHGATKSCASCWPGQLSTTVVFLSAVAERALRLDCGMAGCGVAFCMQCVPHCPMRSALSLLGFVRPSTDCAADTVEHHSLRHAQLQQTYILSLQQLQE